MEKQDIFKKNDNEFLPVGFKKDKIDPMFCYELSLISDEEIEENDIDEDDIPKLLYGSTGIGSGFCIYTGSHFIWLDIKTPKEAIEFSKHILSFEEC